MKKRIPLMFALVTLLVVSFILAAAAVCADEQPAAAPGSAAPAAPSTGVAGMLWEFLNSAFGIGVLASAVLLILNAVYAKKPAWQAFEGTIIAAVKWAEKTIPDDAQNKSLRRLDEALRYTVKVYEEVQKRRATPAEITQLKEGIQIVHAKLEANENL